MELQSPDMHVTDGPILPPVPALQARSRASHDRLVRAGLNLLAEEGPDAVTVGAVAARADLAVGTVYRRFGNKERLLTALQFAFIQIVDTDIGHHVERGLGRSTDDLDRIRVAVEAISLTFERHARLLGMFLLLGPTNAGVFAEGTRASKAANERFGRSLDGVAIDHRDRAAALDMAFRMVYAACAHRVTHGEMHESDRPLPWRRFHRNLTVVIQRYLLGA